MNSKKNYLYVVVYNILSVITPLITAPYISRVLGTEGVGTYSYYYAITYYFTLIAKLGLTNYGTRRIAEVKSDSKKLIEEFTSIYAMQVLVTVIVSIVYFGFVLSTYGANRLIGLVFGIWVVSNGINIDWFLFGVERFKETSTRNMVVKLVEVVAVFVFIRQPGDVWKYCLIYSLGFCVTYICFFSMGRKYLSFKDIDKKYVLKHIKPCLILMIPVIALSIYRSMDKVMLGYLTKDLNENGLYENAEKIIYSLTMFISSLGQVMMPRMSALLSDGKTDEVKKGVASSLSFICFMTNAMCFGVLAVSYSLVPWFFGEEFSQSALLMNILAVTLIFIGWGNVVRTQYIIPKKKDNIYIISISLGAVLNLIVNALLIPKFGAVGACIGTVIAEFSVPVYQSFVLRKELDTGKMLIQNFKFTVYGLIMFAVLMGIQYILGTGFATMLLQIVVGGVIYLGLSYKYIKDNIDIKRILKRTR